MNLSGTKVLVTGAKGMLAQDVIFSLRHRGANLILADIREIEASAEAHAIKLDITNQNAVVAAIERYQPEVVINCAAHTAVDQAEDQIDLAFNVNAIGPGNLAKALQKQGGLLVHISSDYVFGGDYYLDREPVPYREEERFSPCGIYGHSKRFGDELIYAALPLNHLVLRTSWLHGAHGPNFVATIAKVAKEKTELKVVNDQVGSPTWSLWLAETMLKLIENGSLGTFHVSSRGNISWYEFAMEIVRLIGVKTNVLPQTTAELGRKAKRPAYSTLDVSKLEKVLGEEAISWKEGLALHLRAIGEII